MSGSRICVECEVYVDARTVRCERCGSPTLRSDEFVMPDMAPPRVGRRLLDARIGTVLENAQVVESFLGFGAEGPVYAVRDRRDGVRHALKRERGSATSVQGGNVVRTVGKVRSEDDKTFLLIEQCTGGSLQGWLDSHPGALEVGQAIAVLKQVVQGLVCYHRAGLAHGDLKPDNVLLAREAKSKATVLKLADPLQADGAARGTPPYAAPEVCGGASPTPAADFWALGVIAYQLLAGRLPFEAAGKDGLVLQVTSDSVPVPALDRRVGSELQRLVGDLLRRPSAERLTSADEVLARLEAAAVQSPAWVRQAALVAGPLGGLLLLLGLLFGLGGGPTKPHEPNGTGKQVAQVEPKPDVGQKPVVGSGAGNSPTGVGSVGSNPPIDQPPPKAPPETKPPVAPVEPVAALKRVEIKPEKDVLVCELGKPAEVTFSVEGTSAAELAALDVEVDQSQQKGIPLEAGKFRVKVPSPSAGGRQKVDRTTIKVVAKGYDFTIRPAMLYWVSVSPKLRWDAERDLFLVSEADGYDHVRVQFAYGDPITLEADKFQGGVKPTTRAPVTTVAFEVKDAGYQRTMAELGQVQPRLVARVAKFDRTPCPQSVTCRTGEEVVFRVVTYEAADFEVEPPAKDPVRSSEVAGEPHSYLVTVKPQVDGKINLLARPKGRLSKEEWAQVVQITASNLLGDLVAQLPKTARSAWRLEREANGQLRLDADWAIDSRLTVVKVLDAAWRYESGKLTRAEGRKEDLLLTKAQALEVHVGLREEPNGRVEKFSIQVEAAPGPAPLQILRRLEGGLGDAGWIRVPAMQVGRTCPLAPGTGNFVVWSSGTGYQESLPCSEFWVTNELVGKSDRDLYLKWLKGVELEFPEMHLGFFRTAADLDRECGHHQAVYFSLWLSCFGLGVAPTLISKESVQRIPDALLSGGCMPISPLQMGAVVASNSLRPTPLELVLGNRNWIKANLDYAKIDLLKHAMQGSLNGVKGGLFFVAREDNGVVNAEHTTAQDLELTDPFVPFRLVRTRLGTK